MLELSNQSIYSLIESNIRFTDFTDILMVINGCHMLIKVPFYQIPQLKISFFDMLGSTRVTCSSNYIEAVYIGQMTIELLEKTNTEIRKYIDKGCGCVLYNTLQMQKPEMKHSLLMKKFDSEISRKMVACATVTSDPTTAFMAKLAFIFTPKHEVFYNKLDEAKLWLTKHQSQLKVA